MSIKLIAWATLIIASLSIGSRIVGFIREIILAAYFGVSSDLDTFLIAQVLPGTIAGLFSTSLLAALIPIYNRYNSEYSEAKRSDLASRLISSILFISVFFLLAAFFAAPAFISIAVPNWPQENQKQAVDLMRIMLPCFVSSILLAIVNGLQQASSRFLFPYLGPIILNLTVIIGIILFGKSHNIYAIGYATTIGTLFQVVAQWFGLKQIKFTFKFFRPQDWALPKELFAFLVPAFLITVINDSAFLIDRLLVSFFPAGSIATLNYAYKVNALIITLSITSIAVASYPIITACAGRGDYNEMNHNVSLSLRVLVFAIVPAMILMMLFSTPIIRLMFQRGAFDETAVLMTGSVLFFLSLNMVGAAVMGILGQSFCALGDSRVLLQVTAAMIGTKLLVSVIFMNTLAANGLALSTSVSYIISGGLLLYFWVRRFGLLAKEAVFRSIKQVITASVIMGIISKVGYEVIMASIFPGVFPLKMANGVSLIVSITLGLYIYLMALAYLKSEELLWFKRTITNKLKQRFV